MSSFFQATRRIPILTGRGASPILIIRYQVGLLSVVTSRIWIKVSIESPLCSLQSSGTSKNSASTVFRCVKNHLNSNRPSCCLVRGIHFRRGSYVLRACVRTSLLFWALTRALSDTLQYKSIINSSCRFKRDDLHHPAAVHPPIFASSAFFLPYT